MWPHTLTRRIWLRSALGAAGVAAMPLWAQAAPYPLRPIKLIVPFAAGGSTDIVARLVADAMQVILGVAVVVENKAGAGGMLGAETLAQSPADGYTIGLGSISTLAVNPVVLKAARVQPLKDFAMVAPLASIASVFSVPPSLGIHDFAQFLKAARSSGDNWTAGSSGIGSIGHVILEAMNADLGIHLRHIPFKGMGPVVNSALAGQTQVLSDQFPSSQPHLQAGRLVPVAVAAERRLPALPQVPTLAELGYPQLNDLAITWFGLVAPAHTPTAALQRLNAAANQALQQPALRTRLAQLGVTPLGGTSQELEQMVQATTSQVRALVQARGITDGN